jgi:hypothetical protein
MKVERIEIKPGQGGCGPIRVSEVHVSCWGCPKSWNGRTDKSEEIYARYRWGYLGISLNGTTIFGCVVDEETQEEADAKFAEMREGAAEGKGLPLDVIDQMESSDKMMRKFMAETPGAGSHSYHGMLEYDDLVRLTKEWIEWPEHETGE